MKVYWIKEKKANIESNKTPQEITNDLLVRLNENLEKIHGLGEETPSNIDETNK